MQIVNQVFVLFLLLLSGYISKKLGVISNNMNKDMSNFILYVALPGLVLGSLSNYEFSYDMVEKSIILIVISIGVYAFSIALAMILSKSLKIKGCVKDIFEYGVIFSNVGFMGYPVVEAVFGEEGIFYAAVYNLPFNVITWTLGVMIMSRRMKKRDTASNGFDKKYLLNPGIVSVIIGFIMFLTSVKFPKPILQALNTLGSTTTPLSMVFVGSILADIEVKKIFSNMYVFLSSLTRLVFLPLMVLGVLKLFPLDSMTRSIPVIITSMPVAANCAMFASTYENDYLLASQLIFISTLLSMITIPVMVLLSC